MQFCTVHLIRDVKFLITLADKKQKAYGPAKAHQIAKLATDQEHESGDKPPHVETETGAGGPHSGGEKFGEINRVSGVHAQHEKRHNGQHHHSLPVRLASEKGYGHHNQCPDVIEGEGEAAARGDTHAVFNYQILRGSLGEMIIQMPTDQRLLNVTREQGLVAVIAPESLEVKTDSAQLQAALAATPAELASKVPQPISVIVSAEHLDACYRAADRLGHPVVNDIDPADWWRALLVVTYNTGLRRGTLFALQMADIDWQGKQLVIPPEHMKSGQAHIMHLNKVALDHLQKIRTDRELVFPWPENYRRFYLWFHKLQDLANIPRPEHFGLHGIRRTTATALWEIAPQAAQLALGHAGSEVTRKHYVQSSGIVARALDALPQPAAFSG